MRHAAYATVILLALMAPAMDALATESPRVARTTTIPKCTTFVDAAAAVDGNGSAGNPHTSIAGAVAAARAGEVICVAEGIYAEQVVPGEKPFTLAGGFRTGSGFAVRDSARHVSKAQGKGGSFIRIVDPGPGEGQLTAIDGFEITGYSQAIFRDHWVSQRFDITNNYIHENTCETDQLAGAGFALNNVSGAIKGNVFARNACGRGGAGFANDTKNQNTLSIENNHVDANAGTEPGASHGGGLYVFVNKLRISGNLFTSNSVTHWGGGLYVGAYTEGGQFVTATLSGNVYRGNRAGTTGGGFFCDDGATCISDHEVYEKNCGANIYLDSGGGGSGPTTAKFDHLTNVDALDAACQAPGPGVRIDAADDKADRYTFVNAVFRGNATGADFVTGCDEGCKKVRAKATVSHSTVQTQYLNGGVDVTFGQGIVAPGSGSTAAAAGSEEVPPPPAPLGAAPSQPATAETPVSEVLPPANRAPPTRHGPSAAAPADDVTAKEAFAAAKELGTVAAWNAFLANFPNGFHADLARAYLKRLENGDATVPAAASTTRSEGDKPAAPRPAAGAAAGPAAGKAVGTGGAGAATGRHRPAIARGGDYLGFRERFNRYYTDPTWRSSRTLYVSPTGGGDGASRNTPMAVKAAVDGARPGTRIHFLPGTYKGGFEFTKESGGTYDDPVVLYAERNPDASIGVTMACATAGRAACFNFEGADYIAVDGFELVGGSYGVRATGTDYAASKHSRGIAVLNSKGHDQKRDPFFSGAADWAVWEGNVGWGAKAGDGHAIYLSNGSDWNIVRYNEAYSNDSSDFQVNADPTSTCKDAGIDFADPRCDAVAGSGEGGQGASDFFLIESNFFHHGKGNGANFASVRHSVVRNNIFAFYPRHNVSFYQETDNPKLGSSDNKVLHNLFITTGRHAVQFVSHATRNEFANNLVLGVQSKGDTTVANPSATLMGVDDTVGENIYRTNFYAGGKMEGRGLNDTEIRHDAFLAGWFAKFPTALRHDPNDFKPMPGAPFLGIGALSADAPSDRDGVMRGARADPGPLAGP